MAEEDEWDELPDLSFMGDPEELKAKAEAELRAAPNPEQPPAEVHGVDRSGSIEVTVDLEGRVKDVEILDDWNEHLASDEFPRSLFQAYRVAIRNAMKATALAMLAAGTATAERTEEPADGADLAAHAGIPDIRDEHWPSALDAALDEIDALSQRYDAMAIGARETERAVTSPSSCVTVLLRGASVVGIRGNPSRIENIGHDLLRQEVLTAFRRAQR